MLTKELRESQAAFELPAREMMQNVALIGVFQQNNSLQVGLLNIQIGQANVAVVTVGQAQVAAP